MYKIIFANAHFVSLSNTVTPKEEYFKKKNLEYPKLARLTTVQLTHLITS